MSAKAIRTLVVTLGAAAASAAAPGCGGEKPAAPAAPLTQAAESVGEAPALPPNCTFEHGVTTCVTIAQHQEQSTHAEISGCLFGPNGVPGVRTRTFADTVLVTETTTTQRHGLQGKIFDIQVRTTRDIIASVPLSDVCEPL
jgi:hypothetical protein